MLWAHEKYDPCNLQTVLKFATVIRPHFARLSFHFPFASAQFLKRFVQYLFLALRQHGEVELPLERLELWDPIQEFLNPVQINSRGDPPERVIALRAA